ncbi:Crp/Fnr family transcriptional regulator [Paenibacillus sp. GCM10023252]|uniref:Crp/Fnr family transcriptional regulator n=1 Tax=Paenibacillus sp. GCM10023252 TaxID=3252649 RepID=UPI00361F05B6
MRDTNIRCLNDIRLFERLSADELGSLEQLASLTHSLTLPSSSTIQSPEQNRQELHFIKQGKVRLYKINSGGNPYTIGFLGPGDVFGDLYSIQTRDVYMETMEETMICSVPKESFENFLSTQPKLAIKFLKLLSSKIQERDELLEQLILNSLREQVLHLLLTLSKPLGEEDANGTHVHIPISHQELSNMIGAARECVTLTLRELARDGILTTGRKSIAIQLDKALASLSASTENE